MIKLPFFKGKEEEAYGNQDPGAPLIELRDIYKIYYMGDE